MYLYKVVLHSDIIYSSFSEDKAEHFIDMLSPYDQMYCEIEEEKLED